jgi:Cys-rich repeat protein
LTALLAVAGLLAGCPKPPEPPPEPECTDLKPCGGGLVCRDGACLPCRLDNECANVEVCHPIDRRCRLRPCFGADCRVHDDCTVGEFCVQGLCLRAGESSPEGCSVVGCADGEPCNEGQRCHPVNLVCEEDLGCAADADCDPGLRCNVPAARCESACTPETAAEVCGIARVCSAGICVDCLEDADCGAGLRCNTGKNACESLLSCSSNRDCELPLLCNRLTRQCTAAIPPCTSADDCAADETCQLSTGRCVAAFCAADRFEPNDEIAAAKPIALGFTPNLTLCANDTDVFRLGLARGDRLQASVECDPLIPFEIALLGATGEVIAGGDLVADGTVSVAGDYFVRTRSRDAYVRYGLRLAVSRGVPCDEDPEEPNNTFVAATEAGAGELYQKTICPADEDWYVVAVTRDQRFEAELVSSPADGDLDLTLFDENRLVLARSPAAPAEAEEVSSATFTGTRLYLKVAGAGSGVQNGYDLRIRLFPR